MNAKHIGVPTTPRRRRKLCAVTALGVGILLCPLSLASAAEDAGDAGADDRLWVRHAASVLRQVNDPEDDVMIQGGVAASPASPRQAVVTSAEGQAGPGGVGLRYAWTANGGATWHPRTLRGLTAAAGGTWDNVNFPMVAAGVGGDFYITATVGRGECTTAAAVVRSDDHGRRFDRLALTGRTTSCSGYNVKPWVTVDTYPSSPYYGRVYLSILVFHFNERGEDVGQQQFVQYSDDRGLTWSDRVALTRPREYTHFNSMVAQPDGAVTVVYGSFTRDTPPNELDVVARQSRDGGVSFGDPVLVTRADLGLVGTADTRCCAPVASVDPVTGQIYLPIEDTRFREDDINDVLVFRSSDGASWAGPVVASQRHRSEPLEHFTPSIGAYGGTVYVAWTLRRVTGDSLPAQIGQQVAVSTDAGRTFGPPVTVGPAGNLRFAANAGDFSPYWLSDYNATVAVPGRAYTAWPLPTSAESAPHQTLWASAVSPGRLVD